MSYKAELESVTVGDGEVKLVYANGHTMTLPIVGEIGAQVETHIDGSKTILASAYLVKPKTGLDHSTFRESLH